MLVDNHEPVETNGESGRHRHAEGDCSDHDSHRRDPGSLLPQLEPLEIPLGPARHHEGDQPEQEGERYRVAGLEEIDPLRAARDLDRGRKRQEPGEADDQRRPGPASTA
jgi:hypothetical protein